MRRGRSPRRRLRFDRLTAVVVAVLLVVIPLVAGLPANVASSDTSPWPWGLELVHQHAWSAMAFLALVLAGLTVFALRTSWRAEDEERAVAQFSPEALAAAAETLTVNMRDELEDQLRRQVLYRQIDLALGGDPTEPASPGPARLLSELPDVLRNAPRRLVVVGLPGSGKSTVLMLLARQLIAERAADGGIPVVVNLSTWDPRQEHLDSVIRRRIEVPARSRSRRGTGDLVGTRKVLPVLDGLDELPESLWEAAANGLRAALQAGDREFILACGQDVFTELVPPEVRQSGGTQVVSLRPVDVDSTIGYLRSGLFIGDDRWEPVFARLRQEPDGVLARALSSPLMMHLALVVYQNRATDPTRMCDADLPSLESHLLGRYLGSIYGTPSIPADPDAHIPRRRRYSEAKAHRWLTFLAGTLSSWRTTAFTWWHLHAAATLHKPGNDCVEPDRLPSRWRWRRSLSDMGAALATALTIMVLTAVGFTGVLTNIEDFRAAVGDVLTWLRHLDWLLVAAVVIGILVVAALWSVLVEPEPGLAKEVAARAELAADRRLAWVRAVFLSTAFFGLTVLGWPLVGPLFRWRLLRVPLDRESPDFVRSFLDALADRSPTTLVVLGILAAVLLIPLLLVSAWCQYRLTVLFLGASGRVPLRFLTFLEDAQARGVLRRNGTAFEFRHRSVQRHLARREVSADPVDRAIERAWEAYAQGRHRHAYRLLESRAMHEVVARRALIDMFGGVPVRPLGPIAAMRNARMGRAAVDWWTTAMEDDVPGAALGRSDLYEWLIQCQPAVPYGFVRAIWVGRARKFWGRQRMADPLRRNALERDFQECFDLALTHAAEFIQHVRAELRSGRR